MLCRFKVRIPSIAYAEDMFFGVRSRSAVEPLQAKACAMHKKFEHDNNTDGFYRVYPNSRSSLVNVDWTHLLRILVADVHSRKGTLHR